jgi:hypothetical protein
VKSRTSSWYASSGLLLAEDDVSGLENADGLGAVENAGGLAGDEEDYE